MRGTNRLKLSKRIIAFLLTIVLIGPFIFGTFADYYGEDNNPEELIYFTDTVEIDETTTVDDSMHGSIDDENEDEPENTLHNEEEAGEESEAGVKETCEHEEDCDCAGVEPEIEEPFDCGEEDCECDETKEEIPAEEESYECENEDECECAETEEETVTEESCECEEEDDCGCTEAELCACECECEDDALCTCECECEENELCVCECECEDDELCTCECKCEEKEEEVLSNFSDEFEGEGTQENPYIIEGEAGLLLLAEKVNEGIGGYNEAYYQISDINNIIDIGSEQWTPIGTPENPFKGTFDGNKTTITGLKINNSALDYAGLFGYVENGAIKNLGISDVNIAAGNHVGGLAGFIRESMVSGCFVMGKITGNYNVGGLIGSINGSIISDCYTTGTITGVINVGGISGDIAAECEIQNCYSIAEIIGIEGVEIIESIIEPKNIGGIAGNVNGTIKNCVALNPKISGDIETTGRVAGNVSDTGALIHNYAFEFICSLHDTFFYRLKLNV